MYTVKKRGQEWTVGCGDAYLSFRSYTEAIETAQGAAEVFRRNGTRSNKSSLRDDITAVAQSPGTSPKDFQNDFRSTSWVLDLATGGVR
jgi:hypothetical protein